MKTKVWAHRGASGYRPENTLEAFELAIRQGADVKSSGHISYINMIFIFLNYSIDFNRIRTDL